MKNALVFLALASVAPATYGAVYNATPSNYNSLMNSLQPGDTLILTAGTYRLLSINNLNGTPTQWITITGPTSGAPAVIHGAKCCNAIEIAYSSYLAIENLYIDSQGLPDVDGISAHNGTANLVHDILIQGNTFVNQNSDQQCVAISTKTPTWGWIIRGNTITGAGTGIYLGDSVGDDPFIGGLIENNLVQNTIGYDMEIKYQNPRPAFPGIPTNQNFTIIRNNVFIKNDQKSPDGNRPNVLVGGFPSSGPGSTDMYEIYGNLFYHNPREALLQASGRVSVHDNVFVDGQYSAATFQDQDLPLMVAYVYNNTIYSTKIGIDFGTPARTDDLVTGNLVFGATPLAGQIVNVSNNITGSLNSATKYVNAPSLTLGAMNFYPLVNTVQGPALDLSKVAGDTDYLIDFNGTSKTANAGAVVFRGAYAGEGVNPGWVLQDAIKPVNAPASQNVVK